MFSFLQDLQDFTEKVIPDNAPEIQIKEMRKAFVAGAKLASHKSHTLSADDFMDYRTGIDDMFEYRQ